MSGVFFQEGVFFSKAAIITFGGAYAVLPYVAQQAVEKYAWLSTSQMIDGLGLAETTPGPLIMVLQLVGVVLNLAVWFGFNVLFPNSQGIDYFALLLAALAFILLQYARVGLISVVAGAALLGLIYRLIFG